jgi:GntR family transcriptional regulator, transcriptional repressor for pyruvate dehydrogenase complex
MASRPAIDPADARKASAVLADDLRETILGGGYPVGAPLPTERELAERAGVSRSSVREALRILETEGLIATRPGRNGGPSARRPTAQTLERQLTTFIRGHELQPGDLSEALLAIEPGVARLAAMNRTDEDLERLRELIERFVTSPDRSERLQLNAELRVAVADASHNELLRAVMAGLSEAIHVASSSEAFAVPGVTELAAASYEGILQALVERDPDAAERRVRRHVTRAAKIALEGVDAAELEEQLEELRRRRAARTRRS